MSVKMFFKAVHEEKRPVKASVRTTQTGSVVPVQAHQANRRIADQDAPKPRQMNLFGQQDLFQRKPELAEAKRTIEDKPADNNWDKMSAEERKELSDKVFKPSEKMHLKSWKELGTVNQGQVNLYRKHGTLELPKAKKAETKGEPKVKVWVERDAMMGTYAVMSQVEGYPKTMVGSDEFANKSDAEEMARQAEKELNGGKSEPKSDEKWSMSYGSTKIGEFSVPKRSTVEQAKATIEGDSVKEKTKDHLDNGMRQWIIEASQPGVDPDLKSSTMKHIQAVIQREGLDKKMIDAEIKKYAQKPSENSDSAKTQSGNTPEKSFNPTVSYGGSGNVDNAALRLASIIDQHQRRMGGRVYAIYLPSSGKHSGKLSFQRDGERLPDGWKYITPESAIHGDLTKEQLAGRLRQHIGRLNMLPYENKTLDEHLEKLKSLKGNELETASWTQRHDKMLEAYDSADDSQKLKFMKDLKKNDLIDSVSGGKRKPLSAYDIKHAIRNHLLNRAKYGRI